MKSILAVLSELVIRYTQLVTTNIAITFSIVLCLICLRVLISVAIMDFAIVRYRNCMIRTTPSQFL